MNSCRITLIAAAFLAVTAPVVCQSPFPNSGPAAGGTRVVIPSIVGDPPRCPCEVGFGGISATNVFAQNYSVRATTPALPAGTLNDLVAVWIFGHITRPAFWMADFLDVPQGDIFHDDVERLYRSGITAGCGNGNYCRDEGVRRDQMAVLLLKSTHGSTYAPPACTPPGRFLDVPCPGPFADWIELLAAEGITGGCGPNIYCPESAVRRGQMASFLLKTTHGSAYDPPDCTGTFNDVPCTPGRGSADWIEQLAAEFITAGCGNGNYCPDLTITRGQMAVFLARAFGLQ